MKILQALKDFSSDLFVREVPGKSPFLILIFWSQNSTPWHKLMNHVKVVAMFYMNVTFFCTFRNILVIYQKWKQDWRYQMFIKDWYWNIATNFLVKKWINTYSFYNFIWMIDIHLKINHSTWCRWHTMTSFFKVFHLS